jgi:ATP-dependent Clp protease ATP-binding subunit ClpA
MSEYKERASIYNLIGSPKGHIAFEEGGRLTNMVRQKPFSIILLDEVEKAHPDVLDIFIQVFDEGRLTDNEDRPCDFTNTIIIMTSNLGMDLKRQGQMGFTSAEASSKAWMGAVEGFFRPEFLNRIDKILVFNPLSKDGLKRIFQLLLSKVQEALAKKNVELNVTDEAINLLIGTCDLNYGARPLRRAIEEYISEPLSKKLLAEEIRDGDAVTVSEEKGQIKFTVKRIKNNVER